MTSAPFPGESAPTAPRVRRWPRRLGIGLLGILTFLGPWPVDNASFRGSAYESETLGRLARVAGPSAPGPIRIGVAEVDLTPDAPVPLAGFSVQAGKPFASIDTRCHGRALSVASRSGTTTIVTADLLLINSEMARLIAEQAGVPVDDLVFTSSHTHGGPGSWGRHPLERLVAGRFDPAVLRMLADRLGDAVKRSRAELTPSEMAFVQTFPEGRQKNRVVPGADTHDALSALVFRPVGSSEGTPPIAILTVFGAHATVVRADPPRLSADYPGALVASLKARTGAGSVLFAAGAVGDAAPIAPKIAATPKAAKILGEQLAGDLIAVLPSSRFSAEVSVDHRRLAVDLPPVRLSFFSSWLRFSPLATWWIADQTTHLDAFRIGPAVLLGFPGDEAGHLARRVVDAAQPGDPVPIVTSFNGDYRGYFESRDIFHDRSCYETRWMNFYGPWLGEYLGMVASQMALRLSGRPLAASPILAHPEGRARTFVALLVVLGIVGAVARGRLPGGPGGRSGSALAVGLAVAFVVNPRWMDWSRVGIWDEPGTLLGLIFGIKGALGVWRSGSHTRLNAILGWLGVAFLTASWAIVLATALIALTGRRRTGPVTDDHQSK
jgi:neutral ceramidase